MAGTPPLPPLLDATSSSTTAPSCCLSFMPPSIEDDDDDEEEDEDEDEDEGEEATLSAAPQHSGSRLLMTRSRILRFSSCSLTSLSFRRISCMALAYNEDNDTAEEEEEEEEGATEEEEDEEEEEDSPADATTSFLVAGHGITTQSRPERASAASVGAPPTRLPGCFKCSPRLEKKLLPSAPSLPHPFLSLLLPPPPPLPLVLLLLLLLLS